MNEKKNIDRIFREKFKDFEVAPPEFVWENIQEALQEKKKRRIIPLWFRLSGVAALLAIGGLLVTPYFNETDATKNPVVIDNNDIATPGKVLKTMPAGTNAQENENDKANDVNTAVASGGDQVTEPEQGSSTVANPSALKDINRTPALTTKNNAVASEDYSQKNIKNNSKPTVNKNSIPQDDALVHDASSRGKTEINASNAIKGHSQPDGIIHSNEKIIAAQDNESKQNTNAVKDKIDHTPVQQNASINANSTAKEGIAANDSNSPKGTTGLTVPTNDNAVVHDIPVNKNLPVNEAIAEAAIDTAAVIAPENELEKILQERLNDEKEDKEMLADNANKAKWSIKPQVSSLYYNSLSEGSPIDPQFAANDKSYDNGMGYGLGIDYAISNRISIRSGINTVNLNYATNDISFYATFNTESINVSGTKNANIVVGNGSTDPFTIGEQSAQTFEGSMIQKTGYIEVPLEMSYALLNKKFGIDIIGGVSTLFLNKNEISVVSSQGYGTEIGQAQNLNNIHFSTNVGLGFRYNFLKSFDINFEPMFKYQVNTFSKDAGNFKPYYIGLYTGLRFSF